MSPRPEAHGVLRRLLRHRQIATLDVLFDALGTHSRMTVFRRLREIGYRSSFTHSGRYYTLGEIPRFDSHGLWFYENVGFSRIGTLKQTVAQMVPEAPAGRTHGELSALLRVPVQRPLRDLFRAEEIGRHVLEGIGEFVYVSSDPTQAERQISRRIQTLGVDEAPGLPPTETVLRILAAALRASRIGVTSKQLARRLSAQGLPISREDVERVFQHYGLSGGKKTSLPRHPSRHEEAGSGPSRRAIRAAAGNPRRPGHGQRIGGGLSSLPRTHARSQNPHPPGHDPVPRHIPGPRDRVRLRCRVSRAFGHAGAPPLQQPPGGPPAAQYGRL